MSSAGDPSNLLDALGAVAVASPVRPPAGTALEAKLRSLEDDDLALARMLQEQERAFYLASLAAGGPESQQGGEAFEDCDGAGEDDRAVGSASPAEEDVIAVDDEELARRMQAEMDRQALRELYAAQGIDVDHLEQEVEGVDIDALTYSDLTHLGEVVGTVSRGLSEAARNQLPVLSFTQLTAQQHAQGSTMGMERCCICLCDFEAEDKVTPLLCQHAYHTGCLHEWLGINKVCPVCHHEVPQAATQQAP